MKYDLVIFDLDGTVLNTLADLTEAVNAALSASGFPVRTREDVRRFIGNGVANLIRRASPEGTPEDVCQRVLSDFRTYYAAHVNVHTRPYEGIPELLQALRMAGIRAAVNSNKLDEATQRLCQAHFDGLLDCVLGEREGVPRKPAPDGALLILRTLGTAPDRALYVGDSETDILTAQNAGMDGGWVSWGFRRREELDAVTIPRAFDTVDALRRFILEA